MTDDLGYGLIKKWEQFRSKPYRDGGGVPTIGYGTTRYPNGVKVTMNDPAISEETAVQYMVVSVTRVNAGMAALLKRPPTPYQHAALLDLVYNIGVGVHDGKKGDFADSTLLAHYNAGDFKGAADHFMDWVYDDHVVVQGLVNRRHDDQAMFKRTV